VVEGGKGQANGRIDLQKLRTAGTSPSSAHFLSSSAHPHFLSLSLPPSPLLWYGSKNRKQWNTKNRERETDRKEHLERGRDGERYKQRNTLHKQMGNWKERRREREKLEVVNKIVVNKF